MSGLTGQQAPGSALPLLSWNWDYRSHAWFLHGCKRTVSQNKLFPCKLFLATAFYHHNRMVSTTEDNWGKSNLSFHSRIKEQSSGAQSWWSAPSPSVPSHGLLYFFICMMSRMIFMCAAQLNFTFSKQPVPVLCWQNLFPTTAELGTSASVYICALHIFPLLISFDFAVFCWLFGVGPGSQCVR